MFNQAKIFCFLICYNLPSILDVDAALNSFTELQSLDPYRLENMDTFSNLLYVKEMRFDLAYLAHKCCDIDKYRVETCCVIGIHCYVVFLKFA